ALGRQVVVQPPGGFARRAMVVGGVGGAAHSVGDAVGSFVAPLDAAGPCGAFVGVDRVRCDREREAGQVAAAEVVLGGAEHSAFTAVVVRVGDDGVHGPSDGGERLGAHDELQRVGAAG